MLARSSLGQRLASLATISISSHLKMDQIVEIVEETVAENIVLKEKINKVTSNPQNSYSRVLNRMEVRELV